MSGPRCTPQPPACMCLQCAPTADAHTPGGGRRLRAGPLGQGICNAVGLAVAEANLAARFNKPDAKLVDHYT